jgi:hypothetical protein
MTLTFDRTPQARAWPTDETGLQRQSFKLELVPAPAGAPMIAHGVWSGYGQGPASKRSGGLNASAERIR